MPDQNANQNQNAKELREKIQADVVSLITDRLKSGAMSQDRAKQIAAVVLEKIPEGVSYDELMQIVPKLDDEFAELVEVVIPIVIEYEKKIHAILEERVLKLVRDKKFTEAMVEAKKSIEIEKRLT